MTPAVNESRGLLGVTSRNEGNRVEVLSLRGGRRANVPICLYFSGTQIKTDYVGNCHLAGTHAHTHTHLPLSLPFLFSQDQIASVGSICQTNRQRTLALRPADHSFILTHGHPLVPDLLSPPLLCSLSLSVHLSPPFFFFGSSLVSPRLFIRLVLSCRLRFHPSHSVIACPRHSARLHLFVIIVMERWRD